LKIKLYPHLFHPKLKKWIRTKKQIAWINYYPIMRGGQKQYLLSLFYSGKIKVRGVVVPLMFMIPISKPKIMTILDLANHHKKIQWSEPKTLRDMYIAPSFIKYVPDDSNLFKLLINRMKRLQKEEEEAKKKNGGDINAERT
jgi:hypothetical protein